jgi:4-hydroxy-tetrahydrodipicolinate synthase
VIAGTIPALLTPFDARGEVDLELMEAHVAWLAERGVQCVSPMGTTGEGPSLSLAERRLIVERLAQCATLLPMTGCSSLPETIELSRFALDHGAAGVLVAPPWYYIASSGGTRRYFETLGGALGGDARVFAYHIPSMTRNAIDDDVLRLPSVAGVKDSGGVLANTVRWHETHRDRVVLSGSDATAAAFYAAGGRGTLTMLANVFPERLEAIRAGDGGDEHQAFLVETRELIETMPRHATLKYLLHRVAGMRRAFVRTPLDELTHEHERRLDEFLDSANYLV